MIRNLNFIEILKTFVKKKSLNGFFIWSVYRIYNFSNTDGSFFDYSLLLKKNFKLAIFTTLFSVLGGIVAYFLGNYLWVSLEPFVEIYFNGIFNSINEFEKNFLNLGIFLIIFGGISPFPFKVTCLASGILIINFAIFVLDSTASRGIRFLLVSYLIYRYGEKSLTLVTKHLSVISLVLLVIIFTMTIYYLI